VKWKFVKIWKLTCYENHENYHRLQFEFFLKNNTHIAIIIVDDGKIYNFKISKRIPELITGGSLIMKQI
jgi:hypothetical protein